MPSAVKILITLDAPDGVLAATAFGAGSKIQLQSGTTEAMADAVDVTRITIVAATYAYEYWATGDATTWFRWRVENTGDTNAGAWSDPFQGWDPATAARNSGAYATIDDLLLTVQSRPPMASSSDRYARWERALVDATDLLDEEIGRRHGFFRSPQTGATEVRTFDGTGDRVLHIHGGIVSLAGLRVRLSTAGDWATVPLTDVRLEYWADLGRRHDPPAGEPYDHVVFTGSGADVRWPRIADGAELTGAFDWPKVPRRAVRATVDWARQLIAADPTMAGGVVGPTELGQPVGPNRMPEAVYRLRTAMAQRHRGCSM